jgi:hypothetical protein
MCLENKNNKKNNWDAYIEKRGFIHIFWIILISRSWYFKKDSRDNRALETLGRNKEPTYGLKGVDWISIWTSDIPYLIADKGFWNIYVTV